MHANQFRWKRVIAGLLVVLGLLAVAAFWYLRGRNSPPIAASGGLAFTNFTAIATPHYLQRDPRWKDDTIGSGETLASVGCTVSSLAMALESHGVSLTPAALNDALKKHDGYTRRGWLVWGAVGKITDGKVTVRALDKPTHDDLDAALQARQPVLVKVFIDKIIPHWVLVSGKDGTNYLMRDPLDETKSLKPVAHYASEIFGVRVVEKKK